MDKKFNIKITNNETGEVLHEADTCAIIGGFVNDEGAVGLLLTHCHPMDHATAINAAETAINKSYQFHPELKLMTLFASANSETVEKNAEEENG